MRHADTVIRHFGSFFLPLTSYFLLLTSYFLLLTSYFLLLTSYFLLLTSYFLLLTSYFLLLTSYFLRLTAKKFFKIGILPATSYGHAAMGMCPSSIQHRRTMAADSCGKRIKTARTTTILHFHFGESGDPAIWFPLDQLRT